MLDSAGRAVVFLTGSYKFRLEDSLGNLIRETDNVTAFSTQDSTVDNIIANFTEDVIQSGDSVIFSDVSDSGNTKRDTVQGIIDLITPLIPSISKFTSSDQTITNAGTLSIAHGLGAKPLMFRGVLKCTTAELGYTVGDEVSVAEWIRTEAATANYGFILTADATNIHVRFGTNGMLIKNKGADTTTLITNASWRLVVKAIL